ncbi:GDSL esterase/lipase [Dorcoceras hygrometricum]|uniref:GDSL esterase/lipase n=1 Tax=Dorcoceras hygrometricum TaxID=472368 RepID=A0A2Z7AKN7_9LAMI|nr:GDSL esterase/lipase [Dorcoceras hygrometricum]
MADISCFFLYVGVLFYLISCSAAQSVLALYVFGDSLADVGNNKYLPLSIVRADFPHNGIDYPGKKATGRFSNGKNAADIIAEKLGIPSAPAYLSQPNNNIILKGVNFASGGAGIFNATEGGIVEQVIPLAKQVTQFSTVVGRLVQELGLTAAQEHLAKSLFPIVIGSNDILGYFKPDSRNSNKTPPQQYIALMLSTMQQLLKGLQGLGARKFLFIGLPPIGCAPKQRSLGNNTDVCNEQVNFWANEYNRGFTHMLQQLKLELNNFHYSYFDTYSVFLNFIHNPTYYGLKDIKAACCGLGKLRAEIPCTPISQYCSNRNEYLFWDIYHPTEAAVRIFVDILFAGSGRHLFPITLQQLIAI